MKSVYCAVRTESLTKAVCASYLKGYVQVSVAPLAISAYPENSNIFDTKFQQTLFRPKKSVMETFIM
jgi:hypothetical protein